MPTAFILFFLNEAIHDRIKGGCPKNSEAQMWVTNTSVSLFWPKQGSRLNSKSAGPFSGMNWHRPMTAGLKVDANDAVHHGAVNRRGWGAGGCWRRDHHACPIYPEGELMEGSKCAERPARCLIHTWQLIC